MTSGKRRGWGENVRRAWIEQRESQLKVRALLDIATSSDDTPAKELRQIAAKALHWDIDTIGELAS